MGGALPALEGRLLNAEEFIARLEGVEKVFTGWVARCPSHADSSPSLSISDGEKGLVLYCHAGCATQDVVDAMGLRLADLFYESRSKVWGSSNLVAWYDYHDELGRFVFRVDRLEWFDTEGKKHKSFVQKQVVNGEWVKNVNGVKLVPYRLPRLLYAVRNFRTVYFPEGEKDVENLELDGKIATTFPGGAKKMLPRYVKYFIGLRRLVIIRDKDEPGKDGRIPGHEHAELVRDALEGVVPIIEVVEARVGKDYSDHREAGFGPEQLVAV